MLLVIIATNPNTNTFDGIASNIDEGVLCGFIQVFAETWWFVSGSLEHENPVLILNLDLPAKNADVIMLPE